MENKTRKIVIVGGVAGGASAAAKAPGGTIGFVTAPVLRRELADHSAVALDVREPDEFAYEHIAGTRNVPFAGLLAAATTLSKEKDLYLLCQSGVRTTQAAKLLYHQGFQRVHSLEGGLEAWKQAGLPVEKAGGPIPIMRQVQIVAGSLALIGGAVPELRWVAIVVGAGLLFAGLSGTCGMAAVLSRMPWNKASPDIKKTGTSCGGVGPAACR